MTTDKFWMRYITNPFEADRLRAREKHIAAASNAAAREWDLAVFEFENPGLRAALSLYWDGPVQTTNEKIVADFISQLNSGCVLSTYQIRLAMNILKGPTQ